MKATYALKGRTEQSATIHSVQYLRGLAALLVLLSHVATKSEQLGHALFPQLHFGVVGVDLFFVISGFIMSHIYMSSGADRMALLDFWKRRIVRILPMYWLLTLFALLIFLTVPGSINSSGGKTSIWKSFLLIPGEDKFLIQNGWTLSFEFYFYAIFSLAILLTNKLLGMTCSVLVLACLTLLNITGMIRTEFFTNPIILEFAYGIVVYLLCCNRAIPYAVSWIAISSGAVGLALYSHSSYYFHIDRYIAAGVPAAVFAFGIISAESRMPHNKLRLLGKLGDSSYSMYLFHPFPLALAGILFRKVDLISFGPAVEIFYWLLVGCGTITVSHYMFIYIESPLIRRSRTFLAKKPTRAL